MNRLEIQKSELLPALKRVVGSVGKGNSLPIIRNIKCSVTGTTLNLTATDFEIQTSSTAQCVPLDGDFDFTINADNAIKIVSQLPGDVIDFVEYDNQQTKDSGTVNNIIIKSGKSRFKLNTLPAQDFPSLGLETSVHTFNIESSDLLKALKHTGFAVAKNDARYYLNGMLFDLSPNFIGLGCSTRKRDDKQRLRLVGTDGHRMAISDILVDCVGEYKVLVPRRAILELTKLLDSSADQVKIELSTGFVRFTLPNLVLITKTISGQFPEYQRVVPKNPDKTALINREQLKKSLLASSVLSNDRYKGVSLLFEPHENESGSLSLEVSNNDNETAQDVLDVSFTDEEGRIAFNIQYLLDVISVLECKTIRLEFTDGISSALIADPDNTEEVFVVMPMRL